AYQRLALQKRADFVPAKFQLAHDLLRLAENDEGWRLAQEVQKQDNYHVVAYNLATLKDELDRYRTLENEHFVIRMEAREAEIYGQQVMELLEEARETLCPKYDVELSGPVHVEIFPRQQDFAIRTFGLPGGAGYLGVCFGHLITANSPASQGATPTNWHSVLWHEFCHVVTLQKTANRMPRWLSEGVSVYEERQRNPAWGQKMTPQFHAWLLGDELTPVSQLSGAFLHPPSAQHLQFAYYESSLVVEFLLERLGLDGLRRVLTDLSVGMPIDESLTRYFGSLRQVDQEFAEFAHLRAEQDGATLEWDASVITDETRDAAEALLVEHPRNYFVITQAARLRLGAQQWQAASELLSKILEARPHDTPAARSLARCYRELDQIENERQTLMQLVQNDADAIDALIRLIEIDRDRDDWSSVRDHALALTAVNPMTSVSQQALLDAGLQLQESDLIIAAQRALLQMEPADVAAAHFRLASAYLQSDNQPLAKRHVLMALEEAPRYRDAQRLLLKLLDAPSAAPPDDPSDNPTLADQASEEAEAAEQTTEITEPAEHAPEVTEPAEQTPEDTLSPEQTLEETETLEDAGPNSAPKSETAPPSTPESGSDAEPGSEPALEEEQP
ncbi:MAG: tetratricopeptide repeat protein, partial [Planctomycetales bacterium]|nr:tetratricopeptide repeat protein [Planctomycetales bacterium]